MFSRYILPVPWHFQNLVLINTTSYINSLTTRERKRDRDSKTKLRKITAELSEIYVQKTKNSSILAMASDQSGDTARATELNSQLHHGGIVRRIWPEKKIQHCKLMKICFCACACACARVYAGVHACASAHAWVSMRECVCVSTCVCVYALSLYGQDFHFTNTLFILLLNIHNCIYVIIPWCCLTNCTEVHIAFSSPKKQSKILRWHMQNKNSNNNNNTHSMHTHSMHAHTHTHTQFCCCESTSDQVHNTLHKTAMIQFIEKGFKKTENLNTACCYCCFYLLWTKFCCCF